MANNRMFLVHVPTGLAVGLGKRLDSWEVHEPDKLGAEVEKLYRTVERECEYNEGRDDFRLLLETDSGWCYGSKREDGLIQLVWVEEKT